MTKRKKPCDARETTRRQARVPQKYRKLAKIEIFYEIKPFYGVLKTKPQTLQLYTEFLQKKNYIFICKITELFFFFNIPLIVKELRDLTEKKIVNIVFRKRI